jgi:hypothetical protein
MKYFTQEWCWDDLSDTQVATVLQRYDAYINSVYLQLPFALKVLAKSMNLHDGIIKKVALSPLEKSFVLSGVFGDLEVGYFKLRIEYKGICNFDLRKTLAVFFKNKIEIIRDEIEVVKKNSNVNFVHRFIFSNKSEFQINFCDCSLEIESAALKDYVKKPCSLVGLAK